MSDPKAQQEPTMEEILASIRRIISEEGTEDAPKEDPAAAAGDTGTRDRPEAEAAGIREADAPEAKAAGVREAEAPEAAGPHEADAPEKSDSPDDVLELTEMVQDDGSVVSLAGKREETAAEAPTEETPEPQPEPEAPSEPEPPPETKAEPEGETKAEPEGETKAEPEPGAKPRDEGLVSTETEAAGAAAFAKIAEAVAKDQAGKPGTPLGSTGRTLEDLITEIMRPLLKAWLDENLPPLVERLVKEEIEKMARRAGDR